MYPNLKAEMARLNVSVHNLAASIDKTPRAVRDKMSGSSGFTISEAFTIRNAYFPDMTIEYLFTKE